MTTVAVLTVRQGAYDCAYCDGTGGIRLGRVKRKICTICWGTGEQTDP